MRSLLEREAQKRNDPAELSPKRPDPLLVARRYADPSIALICALFGYGNATAIVRFLNSLDFSLLDADEPTIRKGLQNRYYRFQTYEDIVALFIALRRLRQESDLETLFMKGYARNENVLEGISELIDAIGKSYPYASRGYRFLLGAPWQEGVTSPYKRWNMYLRWMVRQDTLDMGLWRFVPRSRLLIPLDTHTFTVSRRLGLLGRKTYDLKAVFELTRRLAVFDPEDPVKYDFALYRLGQESLLAELK